MVWNPYETKGVEWSDLRAFVEWLCEDDDTARAWAIESLEVLPSGRREPHEYPGPSAGGGDNNMDHVFPAVVQTFLRIRAGQKDAAERALQIADGWMDHLVDLETYPTLKDEAHRYLEGVLVYLQFLNRFFPYARGRILRANEVMDVHAPVSASNVQRYMISDFANTRLVTRGLANLVTCFWWQKLCGQFHNGKLVELVNRAVQWFFGKSWVPPDDWTEAWEIPGWGRDKNDEPFHVDESGSFRREIRFKNRQNCFAIPFIEFSIQAKAIRTVLTLDKFLEPDSARFLSRAQDDLRRWFRKFHYADNDSALARGTGPTSTVHLFKRVHLDGNRVVGVEVGTPWESGTMDDGTPYGSGNLFHPFWVQVKPDVFVNPEGQAGIRRMFRATVFQVRNFWGDANTLNEILYNPDFVELARFWMERFLGVKITEGEAEED